MFSRAALAVFVTVVAEILLFGYVSRAIGVVVVVLLVVASAVAGLSLLRNQFGELVTSGVSLDSRLANRGVLVVAGLLLIMPGLLTSAAGALLTLPPVRAFVGAKAKGRLTAFTPTSFADLADLRGFGGFPGSPPGSPGARDPHADVVDVDLADSDTDSGSDGTDSPADSSTSNNTGSAPPQLG